MSLAKEQIHNAQSPKKRANTGIGIKFYYHHKCSCDVREMQGGGGIKLSIDPVMKCS